MPNYRATRRDFLRTGLAGAAAASAAGGRAAFAAPAVAGKRPPNFVFVICDQLGLDAVAAHGSPDVQTPHLDRLIGRGTTFLLSHSTSPVCSPARSSLMTGRMPVETGVVSNGLPIHASRPNLGHWFGEHGYETVYCGKWHLPGGVPADGDGFRVLPARGGYGQVDDAVLSHTTEAYLRSGSHDRPFLLVASFLQPHDICYYGNHPGFRMPKGLPYEQIRDRLPELPPNHTVRPKAPAALDRIVCDWYDDEQWRYYLYLYARMVEMLDADVGRLLAAVEDSPEAENTVVVFTSDHGDGRGRHSHVSKWYPYDEAAKVPLVVACPGRVEAGLRDAEHLVSGLDVMPTLCDFAGIRPPEGVKGRSLRPLLAGERPEWREFVSSEHHVFGRMVRSERFKYVRYPDDPVEQLFDMKSDPWETGNLYQEARYADVLADHRRMLSEFQKSLDPVETPRRPAAKRERPAAKANPKARTRAGREDE
jgi:choline-sulfatase